MMDVSILSAADKRALLASLLEKKATYFPLSFAQQRLWFLDRLHPDSSSYNLAFGVRLSGVLDITALEKTLNEIVRRHETLRTSFTVVEDRSLQVIAPALTLDLPVVNLQGISEVDRENEISRLAEEETRKPFNLSQAPLLRATLLRSSQTEYVLLLTMHHIISDAWSIAILIQEVATLYAAFSSGKLSPLPELTIQYADFAVWQRQQLQNQEWEAQLAYWQQQLENCPPVLQLPTDRPRPAVQTFRGATQSFSLSSELSQAIASLSRQAEVTLFMTLLAAFKTLLYRYTSQEDILVGSPIANRHRAETNDLIGFFVNTLVLRTDLSGNPSFWELLKRVKECTLSAYAHQDLPFEYLVEKLQPDRDLSHNPLFQVSFGLQNVPTDKLELPGLAIDYLKLESQTANFDLSLDIYETESGIAGVIEYSTDLFDAATISRMVGHFINLLSAITANPQQPISQLPLLSPSERDWLLGEGREGERERGKEGENYFCIHQLFEKQVERTPNAIAVVFGEQHLTYQELDRQANHLAHHLQQLGVEPEVLAGICVDRSLEMVIGILGILKAGGAYVPLDPAYPSERLAFMLADSQVPVLLTQSHLVATLPKHNAQVVCLDSKWEILTPNSEFRIPNSQTLAYIIYTSGSTGKPKGVEVTHANVVRLLEATQSWFDFNSEDAWTLFHSYAFDFSVWEIWGALLYGGRLVIVPYWVSRSPATFYDLLCQQQVTVLNQTPSAFRQLIQLEASGTRSPNLNLRLVIFGGEALEIQSLKPWFESHGDEFPQLVNMYGITETTVHVTYRPLTMADLNQTGSLIGCPIPDLQVYVLDRYLQPVPIGVPGEMYVGGAGLARGYLNRPDLDAEKFISSPFRSERLYKTGDLARYLPNGDLEYLGRIDSQVKIRGFRIELGEIEAALSQHPQVQQAVVIVKEDRPGEKYLAAYVVPNSTPTADSTNRLREYLKARLPEYTIPAAFVFLEAFPLTPSGKIDRRALPAPQNTRSSSSALVLPRTPTEEVIAGIWTQVLGLQQVSVEDNFFDLGGHSLLATQLISRLRTAFDVDLPLPDLFEFPTIATLAPRVETACRQRLGLEIPPLLPVGRNRDLPLSFAQQRLWFLDRLEPGNPAYNIASAVRLTGKLNVKALTDSFNAVIDRHEVLRTSFVVVEGEPRQAIADRLTFTIPIIDVRDEAEVNRLALEEAQQPFDLTRPPLIRVTLLQLGAEERVLLLTLHHIIADGWSMEVLVREVATLYAAFVEGKPSPLPALPIQYADFAVWQRQLNKGWQTQLDYWQQQLATPCPRLVFPGTGDSISESASHSFVLLPDLTAQINLMSRQAGVTLFMTLLAAFQTSLFCLTGTEDIRIGSPFANRGRVELEGLIGFLINTLVLRIDLSGNPSFAELMVRSRQVTLAAYAHQDLPFEKLVEALQPDRNLSSHPLYQAWFVLDRAPMLPVELPELTLTPLEVDGGMARHDLLLAMWESAEELEGRFEYKTNVLDRAAIVRLSRYLEMLLSRVVEKPEIRLKELAEVLTEVEVKELHMSAVERLRTSRRKAID
jgi:amino acid adenylation domain-containing protein